MLRSIFGIGMELRFRCRCISENRRKLCGIKVSEPKGFVLVLIKRLSARKKRLDIDRLGLEILACLEPTGSHTGKMIPLHYLQGIPVECGPRLLDIP